MGYWKMQSFKQEITTIPKIMYWFSPFSGVASWEDDSDPDSVAAFSLLLSVLPSFDLGGLYRKKKRRQTREYTLVLQNKTNEQFLWEALVSINHTAKESRTQFAFTVNAFLLPKCSGTWKPVRVIFPWTDTPFQPLFEISVQQSKPISAPVRLQAQPHWTASGQTGTNKQRETFPFGTSTAIKPTVGNKEALEVLL